MFQESINIHEKQSPFKTILIVIFIITTIIFLILFLNEKKKNQLLTKNTSLYKPDINNYIPIKEQLYKDRIEGAKILQGIHDILNTSYFGKIDFYNKKCDSNIFIIRKF